MPQFECNRRHRHSGAAPTGPACGRPEDKLRAEPGIYEHQLSQGFRGLCSWIPGSRATPAPRNDDVAVRTETLPGRWNSSELPPGGRAGVPRPGVPIAGVEIAYRPVTYLPFDITGQSRQLAGGSVGIFYIISHPHPIRPPALVRMPSNVLRYSIWHETCPVVMLLSREPMDINYAKVPYMCRRGGCHDDLGTFPLTNHGPDYPGRRQRFCRRTGTNVRH